MSRRLRRSLCALLTVGVVYACDSRELTSPAGAPVGAARSSEASLSDQATPAVAQTVIALERSAYLPHDISASANIGPEGGSIEIPLAGAKIVFPAGALSQATHIKMTAKAGWNVAYEFCPHGVLFGVPAVLEQNLDYTLVQQSERRTLQAGYFAHGLDAIFVDRGQSVARVSEVRGVALDSPGNPHIGRFFIYHFSGYIFSTGFAPTDDGGDSTIIQP